MLKTCPGMSQKTTAPESGKNSKLPGRASDTMNLPSPLGEADLKVAVQSPGTDTNNLKLLLNEFRGLHEQRLKWLEQDTTVNREELMKKKEDFLRSYVNDLTDQNQVLLQTIEDLQMGADHKPSSPGAKLHTSECGLDDLNQQRTSLELRHHLQHLRSDMNSIAQLIQQTGHMHNPDAEAEAVSLRSELSALLERGMEEKEERLDRLTEELNGVKQEMKEREEHVKHLDQDVLCLRATQDSLKRTLATKERHTQQLVRDNAGLKESLTSLQSKLQTSECMLSDLGEALDQTKSSLSSERQQKQQIQDQLHHGNKAVERLQQELTRVRRTAEKRMQRREVKICALLKELAEIKKQLSDCQGEVLRREMDVEKLRQERDELRAKMEDRSSECVHLNQTKERLEADLAQSHEKLHILHLEVRSRDQLILQLRDEMKTAEQKYHGKQAQVAALEDEVRHLNLRVTGHQEEACRLRKKVRDTEHLKDQKEKEQQQLRDQLRVSLQQVDKFEGKLKNQEGEVELLQQQLEAAKEEQNNASLQAQEQKETIAIFKQKYTAAIEKVHQVQGQVELLEEELQYSQQQLRESQLATHSAKREQAELERRYQEKVGHWENSQEALDQLTDELQANQDLLRESQQKLEYFESLVGSLQEQVDALKQQKGMLECDLRLYQQSHSHSDEEHLNLQRHRQQLQKSCMEKAERIAECEKAILQMKSELERQTQEKAGLKQSLAASHHAHLSDRSQLEQEATRLKSKVTHLELELADTQKVHMALLRQSEEELKEARQEAARRSREVDAQGGEAQRLREALEEEEERARSAIREKRSLSTYVSRLSRELAELRSKHQVTVEDLAAHAEEARRMEGCLNEGKLAEEKIRSMAVRLETEVAELRRNLQQAVSQKLKAEREKQDAQDQADALRSELEGTRSDNANLCHESRLVMSNVNHWITEQKASNESLAARMKAQSKALLVVTKERAHLQEANDTLKVEVERLREVAERDTERFKVNKSKNAMVGRDKRETVPNSMENHSCVALNLGKIEEMQTRLRSNLEAIGMLNQQLNALSGENKRLRRQLEEERSMRRQVERPLPPPRTSQRSPSIHPPFSFSARPPPVSAFLPSSLPLPHPLRLDPATGDADGILTQTRLSGAVLEKPGESQALSEAFRMRPAAERSEPASLEYAGPGRTSKDLTK